ncbi:hypothetical protein OC861_005320 [Tilletia horrida]|nr:hypothetical protein OC861_005320 [Tilletia horrida]
MSTTASASSSSPPQKSTLADGNCEPCKKGGTPLSAQASQSLLSELNNTIPTAPGLSETWNITPRPAAAAGSSSIPSLERTYLFRNFKHALAFTNAVGEVAEQEGHHPALLTEWGSVKVAWWTHIIGGLHLNDFIMAAKTETLFAEAPGKKQPKSQS